MQKISPQIWAEHSYDPKSRLIPQVVVFSGRETILLNFRTLLHPSMILSASSLHNLNKDFEFSYIFPPNTSVLQATTNLIFVV